MIRTMIRPMITTLINPLSGAIKRIFVELDSVLTSHYLLATPETFTGNLVIQYVTSTTATEMDFADGFGITSGGIFKAPASVTDILLNGISVGLGATAPLVGKQETVEFIGAVSETITVFGQSGSGTNYFNGILSDPSIPGTTFVLDNAPGDGDTEFSQENTFGVELWTFGAQELDGSTVTSEIIAGVSSGGVPPNSMFEVTLSWVNLTGRVRVLCSTDTSLNSGVQVGDTGSLTTILFSTSNTRLQMQDQDGGAIADSVNISTREITSNALEYILIPDANKELFQLSTDETQWDNIDVANPHILPEIIEIA